MLRPKKEISRVPFLYTQLYLFVALSMGLLAFPEGKGFRKMKGSLSAPQIIYIYAGPGASSKAIEHTEHTLKKLLPPYYAVRKITPEQVTQGAWAKSATLFIMPGGADLSYCQSLNGKGNETIKMFVERGGAYLGFCAGAYYGSQQVNFALGMPLEVRGNRELAFFPGVAEGPTLAPYDYASNVGAVIARLQWEERHNPFANSQILSYYNGGGHFIDASSYSNVTVLASYATTSPPKAAIVEIAVNKGKAILSGAHCEFSPELLDPLDPYLLPIKRELRSQSQGSLALTAYLLKRLTIEATPSPTL